MNHKNNSNKNSLLRDNKWKGSKDSYKGNIKKKWIV